MLFLCSGINETRLGEYGKVWKISTFSQISFRENQSGQSRLDKMLAKVSLECCLIVNLKKKHHLHDLLFEILYTRSCLCVLFLNVVKSFSRVEHLTNFSIQIQISENQTEN